MINFLQTTVMFDPQMTIGSGFADSVVKMLFLICFFFYVIFAFVVVRQVNIMRKTLITPFSPVLTTMGYIHLAVSVFFLVLFFFVL